MQNYLDLLKKILEEGKDHSDRTGVGTRRIFGAMLEFDLREGFPVVTARKSSWKSAIAEMVGFINAFDTVEQFEDIGCKFWGANAKGWDSEQADGNYLGRIYGVQARKWNDFVYYGFDQLANVLEQLENNPDSRRMLVTHWQPDEFVDMALPPCHVQYQFLADKDTKELSLKFDMRSTDMVLGAPNNIVGYAWLLHAVALTYGYIPCKLIMTMGDCHIYQDHLEGAEEMVRRGTKGLPVLGQTFESENLYEDSSIPKLQRLEMLRPDMFTLIGYDPHPPIKFDMAV